MKPRFTLPDIVLTNVAKSFATKAKIQPSGFWSKVFPKKERFEALKDVSFSVNRGDILGYIGPNGAGKSTTIKLMTGILTPDSGSVNILGFTPWEDRMNFTQHIGVVFGQKGLLWWDLPPVDTFDLYKEIYGLSAEEYNKRKEMLIRLFDAQEIVKRPTRKLSLGERMRCEIIAALLHKPQVLFLDEPTIGLDAIAKEKMREAIQEINRKEGITVVLTTHDMQDIEALANRIIILDEGKIIYEGSIADLKKKHVKLGRMIFEVSHFKNKKKFNDFLKHTRIIHQEGDYYELFYPLSKFSSQKAATTLMKLVDLSSIELTEPSLEEIIRDIYGKRA